MKCKDCLQFTEVDSGFGNCELNKCMTDVTYECDIKIDYNKPVSQVQKKIIKFIESVLSKTDIYSWVKFTGKSYDEAYIFISQWKSKTEEIHKQIKFKNQQEYYNNKQKNTVRGGIDWSKEDPSAWGIPNH